MLHQQSHGLTCAWLSKRLFISVQYCNGGFSEEQRCIYIKYNIGDIPGLPDVAPAAVTTVPADAAPAVAVRGEGEPTGVDGFDGKLLLVWSGE